MPDPKNTRGAGSPDDTPDKLASRHGTGRPGENERIADEGTDSDPQADGDDETGESTPDERRSKSSGADTGAE